MPLNFIDQIGGAVKRGWTELDRRSGGILPGGGVPGPLTKPARKAVQGIKDTTKAIRQAPMLNRTVRTGVESPAANKAVKDLGLQLWAQQEFDRVRGPGASNARYGYNKYFLETPAGNLVEAELAPPQGQNTRSLSFKINDEYLRPSETGQRGLRSKDTLLSPATRAVTGTALEQIQPGQIVDNSPVWGRKGERARAYSMLTNGAFPDATKLSPKDVIRMRVGSMAPASKRISQDTWQPGYYNLNSDSFTPVGKPVKFDPGSLVGQLIKLGRTKATSKVAGHPAVQGVLLMNDLVTALTGRSMASWAKQGYEATIEKGNPQSLMTAPGNMYGPSIDQLKLR